MNKHTSGPWVCVGAQPDGKGHRYVVSQEGFTVADLQPNGGHNARLIAAAPDLLEALQALMENYETVDGLGFNMFAVAKACRAISKATGENK